MSGHLIGLIGIVVLFAVIALRMPVGFALGVVGAAGASVLIGFNSGTAVLGISPYHTASSYFLTVIPLFVLMGGLASLSGISSDGYKAAYSWIGHIRGGLAMATIGACAFFAGVCGSSAADAVTIARISLGEMRAHKYEPSLATGCIAAGGTLGILIPPSMSFIIYGIITEQSIGRLFLAGIVPGILLTGLFILTIYVITRRNPLLGPPGAKATWRQRARAVKDTWGIAVLFLVVMGGIWGGVFTPTEAAAAGALMAFFLMLIRGRFNLQRFKQTILETVKTSGMIMVLVIGALIFNYFLALSGLPMALAEFITGLSLPPLGILIVILLTYVVLGCLMEVFSMTILTLPIIFPAIKALGFDPIWFGVIFTLMCEMAQITPPVGLNVYVIAGMAPDVPMENIFRGAFPFVVAIAVCVSLLIAFPPIALFLPNSMVGR